MANLIDSSIREMQKERKAEEELIHNITTNGERLGLSWYKYNNEYFQIYNDKILRSHQNNLKINTREGWFILDLRNVNACVIYIDGFEKILNGVSVEDIVIYPDKYFLFKTPDGRITELWRHSAQILVADEIYRLNQDVWCVSSNGIYYITNLNDRETIAVGRYPLIYDNVNNKLSYFDTLQGGIMIDVSHLLERFANK